MLLVDLHGLALAAVQGALVGTQEDAAVACDHADLAVRLVLELHVLVNLEVEGAQLVPVQQVLVGAREDGLLAAVHRDLAADAVQQPHVLKGLEGPGLARAALGPPGRLQEEQRLAPLHPALARGLVLEAHVLVFLQRQGSLLGRGLDIGPGGEPDLRALGQRALARELILQLHVLGPAQGYALAPLRNLVVGPEEQQLGPALHALLATHGVPDLAKVHGAEHVTLDAARRLVHQRIQEFHAGAVQHHGLRQELHAQLLALAKEEDGAAEEERGQRQRGADGSEEHQGADGLRPRR
mmetsp:Transcript_96071/g.271651  ORF Transcript_96071/g.271651 Transcript_96071/m.271651 type:complete len:296 (+) Transcript_96071:1079-1966(+)